MKKKLIFVLAATAILLTMAIAACASMQRYPTCLNDRECKSGQRCLEQLCTSSAKAE